MNDRLHVVALIPARGGSKSVPLKNLHPLGGRPLLAWPVETALATTEIDRVIVSTDDERIAQAAEGFGASVYRRPAELATDAALVIDTIRNLRDELRDEGNPADIMVLLEATSPLRSPGLVSRCIRRLIDENLDSLATFHDASINPERTWRIESGLPRPFIEGAIPWKPRQELTPAYQLNGAVYVFRPDGLPENGPNLLYGRMGAETIPADEAVDIDDLKDFVIANALLESRNST